MKGVLVRIGRGGWTVHIHKHRRVTGYGDGWKKYAEGCPVVDSRTIPQDKLLKWAYQQPLVNFEMKGVRGVKVEQNYGDFGEAELEFINHMHPTYKAIAHLGNMQEVSIEEFCLLAKEWGATVTRSD